MLRTLSRWLDRIASAKTLLPALALALFFMAYLMPLLAERMNTAAGHPVEPIDVLMFKFDPALIQRMVEGYGDAGRAVYAEGIATFDLAYPLAYTFLFCLALALLFRNRPYAPFPLVNLLPLVGLVADLAENACIVYLLRAYPASSSTVASVCTVASAVKWAAAAGVLALIGYGLIRLAFRSGGGSQGPRVAAESVAEA
ncbi:hypothetical protein [Tellurirhabdus rosea]|uniref:hypothetical protein n=1 Tax=Tellurirhabdus rosea TaxID=2674997 RepID=UPI0022523035|nr:hypothetical protein [Tellurirhabdus rosea]